MNGLFSHVFTNMSVWTAMIVTPAMAGNMTQPSVYSTDNGSAYIQTVSATDQDLARAEGFVDDLTNKGIAFLSDSSMSDAARTSAFKKLLGAKFDINRIGRFSMGRYWKQATSAQQASYTKNFKDMLISTYSKRFKDYQGQEMQVMSAKAMGSKDIVVGSKLVQAGKPSVNVDWRLRKNGSTFKVIDVIVEGVSMAVTQRSEFSSVIQRGGGDVDVLIDYLKEN